MFTVLKMKRTRRRLLQPASKTISSATLGLRPTEFGRDMEAIVKNVSRATGAAIIVALLGSGMASAQQAGTLDVTFGSATTQTVTLSSNTTAAGTIITTEAGNGGGVASTKSSTPTGVVTSTFGA